MNYSFIPIFFLAIRPKTLFASFAPVFLGTAMAFGDGVHDLPTAGFCLAGALLIQIGTNLANDYFDFKKGADTQARVGPVRVTQAGLVTPLAMKVAIGWALSDTLSPILAHMPTSAWQIFSSFT